MADDQTPLLSEVKDESQSAKASITKILSGLIGVFLASADKSILLATQQEIASSLDAPSSAPLLLVSYNLGFCIALPVYGFLSDIYGCRRFLLSAYVLFGVGCLMSGAVTTLWPFVLGRFIAGIGGAGMTDLLSVLVNEIFCITQIASVRSYLIAAGMLGQGCGGPLGGLVADLFGWRWSLIGQVPIGMLCLALAHWQLPASPKKIDTRSRISLWSFDYFGISAFFISVTSFILGTTDGGLLSPSSSTAFLATSGAFLVALILIERFGTKNPIIPPSVVTKSGLGSVFLGQLLFFASVSTLLNNLPPYLSRIDHLSNSAIAMRIWPFGMGLILGSMIAGKAMSKTVEYRKVSLIAIGIKFVFVSFMIVRWANGIHGIELLYGFPWAVGSGLLLSAQFLALTICSPKEQMASATAVYYLSQQVGMVIGTSLSATALQQLFRLRLDVGLGDIALSKKIEVINKIIKDYSFTATLSPALQEAAQHSYIEAYRLIPASVMGLTVLCGLLVLFSKERRIKQ